MRRCIDVRSKPKCKYQAQKIIKYVGRHWIMNVLTPEGSRVAGASRVVSLPHAARTLPKHDHLTPTSSSRSSPRAMEEVCRDSWWIQDEHMGHVRVEIEATREERRVQQDTRRLGARTRTRTWISLSPWPILLFFPLGHRHMAVVSEESYFGLEWA
jgi:hypothetical protein